MGQRSTLKHLTLRAGVVATGAALCALLVVGCTATVTADGSQNTEPVPTATVPAPNGGSTEETVAPVEPGPTQDTDLGETAELEGGVNVTVTDVELLDVEANTPGEIAGPAVALTISVANASAGAVDLSTSMVSVTGANGSYGQATTSEPYSPFLGSVDPGGKASGVYVFRLPPEDRGSLEVRFEYVAGAPIALFVGTT